MSANGAEMTLRQLEGDLRFDRGSIVARDLKIQTDRTDLVTTLTYTGPNERQLEIHLDADRLSLPELGRYFRPVANLKLEPAVDVRATWHARRAEDGRQRRVVGRNGQRAAGRTFRQRPQERRRAA